MAWPATAIKQLRATAGNELCLGLRQGVGRIGRQTASISDAGKVRRHAIGSAVADRHIAILISSDTAHPTPQCVIGGVNTLLYRRCGNRAAGDIQLRPEWTNQRGRGARRVHHPERLRAADFAVLYLLHDARAKRIEVVQRAGIVGLRRIIRRGSRNVAHRGGRAHYAALATIRAGSKCPHLKLG